MLCETIADKTLSDQANGQIKHVRSQGVNLPHRSHTAVTFLVLTAHVAQKPGPSCCWWRRLTPTIGPKCKSSLATLILGSCITRHGMCTRGSDCSIPITECSSPERQFTPPLPRCVAEGINALYRFPSHPYLLSKVSRTCTFTYQHQTFESTFPY